MMINGGECLKIHFDGMEEVPEKKITSREILL
jgi:hypothetical protein